MRAECNLSPSRPRLPITPNILHQIGSQWALSASNFDTIMLWAAAVTCFFAYFRAGEITVPSVAAFDPSVHLAWGNVACDSLQHPSSIWVYLKQSKCDQFGRGVAVFLGRTADTLCPVTAVIAYVTRRGDTSGSFFRFKNGTPLTKAQFVPRIRSVPLGGWNPLPELFGSIASE